MTTPTPAPGRRTARRSRLDVTTLLALTLPVLAVLAAVGVHAGAGQQAGGAPRSTPLDRALVGCPSVTSRADVDSLVATTGDRSGSLAVGSGADRGTTEQPVQPHQATPVGPQAVDADSPLVVTGTGDLAPGLVAGRFTSPLSAADCRAPSSDQWFTGVGAGARHDSTLVLTDPDPGQTVVDVDVLGRDGEVAAPSLREIVVRGGTTRSIDLGQEIPHRFDLTLHVTTQRGRVLASVADSFDTLGSGAPTTDWLPAQDEPATDNLLLGMPKGTGQHVLELANPGSDEGRATIQVVTPQSTFTPEGAQDVTVPAGSTTRVSLDGVLRAVRTAKADQQPVGLEITSTVAMTASRFDIVATDLVRSAPPPSLSAPGAVLLPERTDDQSATLVLAGADPGGRVEVHAWDAQGRRLDDLTPTVQPGQGVAVDLPDDARLLEVDVDRTPVAAAVELTQDPDKSGRGGSAEVLVRTPLTTGLVPAVAPGLS